MGRESIKMFKFVRICPRGVRGNPKNPPQIIENTFKTIQKVENPGKFENHIFPIFPLGAALICTLFGLYLGPIARHRPTLSQNEA